MKKLNNCLLGHILVSGVVSIISVGVIAGGVYGINVFSYQSKPLIRVEQLRRLIGSDYTMSPWGKTLVLMINRLYVEPKS